MNKRFKSLFWAQFLLLPLIVFSSFSGCEENEDEEINEPQDVVSDSKFYFEENAVDSLDALYCDEGTLALFGYRNVPVGLDSVGNSITKEERVIYLTSIEKESGSFNQDSIMAIVVDSTNFPKRIATKDVDIMIAKVSESQFDCLIYDAIMDTWTEYENISFVNPSSDDNAKSRALASSGYSEFGIDDLYKSISIVYNVNGAIKDLGKKELFKGSLGLISTFIPQDELSGLISLMIAPGLQGKAIAACDYLLTKGTKYYEKKMLEWFGKVRISIESIDILREAEGNKSCQVHYKIENLDASVQNNVNPFLTLYKFDMLPIESIELKPVNQEVSYTFENLATGRYCVELYLKHSKYDIGYVAFFSFSISDLSIENYSMASNPRYENNSVVFDINLKLTGDENVINDWIKQEYGYFVDYYGSTQYYGLDINEHPLEKEINFKLVVPRDNFMDTNYYSFVSEAKGYTIGTFATEKGKNIILDEQPLVLVYAEAPEVVTGEVVMQNKDIARVKCTYNNCGFWKATCGVMYGPVDAYDIETIELGKCNQDTTFIFSLTGLELSKVYEYYAFMKIWNKEYYGNVCKLVSTDLSGLCPDENHPHKIDLGLPSGIKWACCNIGASSPEDFGNYYSWGETESKSNYSLVNYKYFEDKPDRNYITEHQFTKIGYNISGTKYDVAHVRWGGNWRMPTNEFEDLKYLESQWITYNGVEGQLFIGDNGNMIFLPAAGRHMTEITPNEGRLHSTFDPNVCCYWTGIHLNGYWGAAHAYCCNDFVSWDTQGRADGLSVRAVWDEKTNNE